MPNTLPTTTTAHGSLTPVTPDDREPINSSSNIKRSASFSCLKSGRRHRTSVVSNTLYPSTSTSTRAATPTTNTATSLADHNISRYLPQNQAVITTQDNWRISLSNHIAAMILSGSKRNNTQDFIGKHILDFIDVSHRPLLLEKIVKRRDDYQHVNINGSVLICGDVVSSNMYCTIFLAFLYIVDSNHQTRWHQVFSFTLAKGKKERQWILYIHLDFGRSISKRHQSSIK